MKSPFPGRGSRSPLHFPLFPLNCQRRWSEAAAVEAPGDHGDGQMRRWSMPWDTSWSEGGQVQQRYLPSKLVVPSGATERSRSTTPGKSSILNDALFKFIEKLINKSFMLKEKYNAEEVLLIY